MKQTRKDRAEALGLRHSKCAECNRWRGRHAATCSHHISEIVRRQMIEKYEIDPEAFKVLLGLLAKRYTAVPFIPPASEARSV